MSDSDLEAKLEASQREVEQLENYLVKCLNLFIESELSVQGQVGVNLTLSDWIETSIQKIKDTEELNRASIEESMLLLGAELAYKDCAKILIDAGDDIEEQYPKNKKVMQLSAAYRHIADALLYRLHILKGADPEELEQLRKGKDIY